MLEHRAAFDNRWNEWSATSTGSNGFWFRPATVITANERGFARLAEFRAFQWQVAILECTSGENTNGVSSWFSGEETSAAHPIARARAFVPPQSLVRCKVDHAHAWSESTLRSKNQMVVRSGMPVRVKFI